MSLIRTGIVLSLVVAVLPSDLESQRKLYDRTAAAVHWTATFCDRNGTTCEQASELWASFLRKAQFGATLAYDAIQHYYESGTAGQDPLSLTSGPLERAPGSGTLTREDLSPAWRGAPKRQGI